MEPDMWPEWFGEPGAYNQPDPIIYWFLVPPLVYLWAIYIAFLFAGLIDSIASMRKRREEWK